MNDNKDIFYRVVTSDSPTTALVLYTASTAEECFDWVIANNYSYAKSLDDILADVIIQSCEKVRLTMIDKSKVNKERVQDLVNALRSGKYKQGFERLRENDCYCVLGVACDISGVSEWKNSLSGDLFHYSDTSTFLPNKVIDYYGIDDLDFSVVENNTIHSASMLNDKHHYSFSKLADLIEETYLK